MAQTTEAAARTCAAPRFRIFSSSWSAWRIPNGCRAEPVAPPPQPRIVRCVALAPRVAPERAAPTPTVSDVDQRLIAIIVSQPEPGETIENAFRRKEAALRDELARLSPPDARGLHDRLANPREHDTLATHFQRLTAARRTRLLALLAASPRLTATRQG